MLTNDPNAKKVLRSLLDGFSDHQISLSKLGDEKIIPKVNDWRYSKGDFYNPIPFRSEIDGFSSPKIIKKFYKSPDEASEKGIYVSGFLDGKLRVVRIPYDLPDVLSLSIYGENPISSDFNIYHVDLPKGGNKRNLPRLNGCALNFKTSPDVQWIIAVGRNSNFSLNRIELRDERPSRELAFASGWNAEVEYIYSYDELGLLSITTSAKEGNPLLIWQRK